MVVPPSQVSNAQPVAQAMNTTVNIIPLNTPVSNGTVAGKSSVSTPPNDAKDAKKDEKIADKNESKPSDATEVAKNEPAKKTFCN